MTGKTIARVFGVSLTTIYDIINGKSRKIRKNRKNLPRLPVLEREALEREALKREALKREALKREAAAIATFVQEKKRMVEGGAKLTCRQEYFLRLASIGKLVLGGRPAFWVHHHHQQTGTDRAAS